MHAADTDGIDPVAPAGMNPASPKLITARYISNFAWKAAFIVAAVVAGYFWSKWFYLAGAAIAAWMLFLVWLIPAQVKRLGWRETEDELCLTRGGIWHTFTVVPYGRIQFVDVTAGPLERWLGLKEVELHTASAGTDATVHGLPADEADALRVRLTEKARERMSGL